MQANVRVAGALPACFCLWVPPSVRAAAPVLPAGSVLLLLRWHRDSGLPREEMRGKRAWVGGAGGRHHTTTSLGCSCSSS